MRTGNALLIIEHTPSGPNIRIAPGLPREMMEVMLAAGALHFLRQEETTESTPRDAAELLEETAKFLRENPSALGLAEESPIIIAPSGMVKP